MPRVRLKGVNKVTKRLADGSRRVYFYHRSSGKRLPDHPHSQEFLAAYVEADKFAPRDTGTVGALIRLYLGSLKFETRRLSTQREYRRILTALETEFGTLPVRALHSPKVRGVFLDYQERIGRDHPREADNRLSVLSAVFSHAAKKGEIRENPIKGFERLHKANRVEFTWAESDINRFMENAPLELQQALILAIHTGQRYGDLIRLRWADYSGTHIRLRQSKGEVSIDVKVTAALQRMLDSMDRQGPFILTRASGRPWFTAKDDKALSKAWREHAQSAGIGDLHFHDLRGTAVTLLAEAGCSIPEIVSITGHSLQSAGKILERYLKRTKVMASAAIGRFENATETEFANRLQTTGTVTRARGRN